MTKVGTRSAVGVRRAGGGGRRLAAAFESVSKLPALAEARRRLLSLCEREAATADDITEAVESDAGLAIAVMRAANNGSGPSGRTGGVVKPVTSARITACGGGKNTGLAGAPTAGRPLRAATSAFSVANAARSTSRSRDIHVMSPGSVMRTIGCQMNGT